MTEETATPRWEALRKTLPISYGPPQGPLYEKLGKVIEFANDLEREVAALTTQRDELQRKLGGAVRELEKWQRPFDQERFDAVKQQASHGNSLAAYAVYVTALEHALKHSSLKAERDAAKRALAEERGKAIEECARFVGNLDLGPWRQYGDLLDRISAGIAALAAKSTEQKEEG